MGSPLGSLGRGMAGIHRRSLQFACTSCDWVSSEKQDASTRCPECGARIQLRRAR